MYYSRKPWLLFVTGMCLFTGSVLSAQFDAAGITSNGLDDTEKILQEYLRPYANIIGADLNAGWYNTARPHKLGGLDVTATLSWAKAPASALTYDLSTLNLNADLDPNHPSTAPTIAGQQEDRPVVYYTENVAGQDIEYARFTHPDGTGYDFFPLPMAQLTVGLPFGTDVSARFVPMISIRDFGEIGLWGVGGKHSISQWIPVLKELDLLDISLQGGYTNVKSSSHIKMEPFDVDIEPDHSEKWDDQYLMQQVEGWTLNLIASQTLLIFTIYEGIGYSSSMVDVLMEGHYPAHTVITEGPDIGSTTYSVMQDPVSLSFKNYNNVRLNIGARILLGVLTLHYDFTHTLYSTHTVGIGISFR